MRSFRFKEDMPLMLVIAFCFLLPELVHGKQLWSRDEMVRLAGYGEERLSTVLVTGSILCKACLPGEDRPLSFPIPGALVAVKCHTGRKTKPVQVRAVADEYGEFVIDLPTHLHAVPHLEKRCLVQALHIPRRSKCQSSHANKHRGVVLSSVRDGTRTYTTGSIKFSHRFSRTCFKKTAPQRSRLNDRKEGTEQKLGSIFSAY